MTDIEIIRELGKINNKRFRTCKASYISPYNRANEYIKDSKNNIVGLSLTEVSHKSIELLSELTKLNTLTLSTIPDNISPLERLINLKNLSVLGDSDLKKLEINNLKNLNFLTVCNSNIEKISLGSNLNNLEDLSIHGNKIKDLSFLKNFTHLKKLNLGGNPIKDFSILSKFHQLKVLYLWGTGVKNLSFLSSITSLTDLYLRANRISDISALNKLSNLAFLDLRENEIEELPKWITNFKMEISLGSGMPSGQEIYLNDNPIKNPPIEIVIQGKDAIKRYFNKIEQVGIDYIYEAKLTLVGEGSAGKTSLQTRLLNQKAKLPERDKRTRGIKIYDWIFKKSNKKKHIVHIWDFGGQDVYYPVHRFFLTEDSVFVLLASTRQTGHNFEYWIPTIYQFGGKSPVILGQTCHDDNKIPWNDLGYYVGHPNFNIIKTNEQTYFELNLPNKNEGLKEIKNVIINQITSLPHYGKGVPKSWIPIREALYKKSKRTASITFDMFAEICRKSNPEAFSKPIDIRDCGTFLHRIGAILWYSEIEELKDIVVLQPEWAMNAVYKIIDDDEIQKRKGQILAKDFDRLWTEKCYEGKHAILKKMLEEFKIAFPKKHRKNDFIMPARLVSMPSETRWKNDEPYLRLVYEYDFMPRGMVNQLSAEVSRYIKSDQEVWNNAVNLIDIINNAECQIEEDFYKRTINIKAKGKDARGLIRIVMNALKDITEGYKGVKERIIVPCICSSCKTNSHPTPFSYDKLLEWSSKRKNAKVTCNEGVQTMLIDDLLFHIGLPNPSKNGKNTSEIKKLFISYSKHNVKYLREFETHLTILKDEGLITFTCEKIDLGDKWDEKIKKEIDECDAMICLVSANFLDTKYIKKIEVPLAQEKNKTIVPIIIEDCDWQKSPLKEYQAALRGKIISLNNEQRLKGKVQINKKPERAAYWREVIQEIRDTVLKEE